VPIRIDIDLLLVKRKISSKELADAIQITPANLSILKTGKARAIRLDTLAALCRVLDCQPGDLLAYVPGEENSIDFDE
jgi:putative transcriptional regulator